MAQDDRAVVVGITRYPELSTLGGPENDAVDFAAWLTDPSGGAIPPDRVACVFSSQFAVPSEPTTDIIDKAFERIIRDADQNGGRGGRRLYLFFAGHGFAPSINESALLMADAARGMTGHHIPGRLYSDWFRTAALFDEVVLLMDCCREVKTSAPPRVPPWDPRIGVRPSRAFLGFATEMGSASRERPSVSDHNKVRGRFTEAVVAGLRHATDAQGRVTNKTLPAFVFNLLTKEASDNHETSLNQQEPKFTASDDMVFAEIGAPYVLTVTFGAEGPPELVSGDLTRTLQPDNLQAASAQWRLMPGLYLLRRGPKQAVVSLLGAGGEEHVAF